MDRGVTVMDIILRAGQAGIMAATITEDIIQVEFICTYRLVRKHNILKCRIVSMALIFV